jgi:hypothetical protein
LGSFSLFVFNYLKIFRKIHYLALGIKLA